MAGNARFESPSASSSEPGFSGSYSNGKRGGPNLDRSGSFREGAESRLFNSGISVTRGGSNAMVASGHFPSLSQCLSLDPIPVGDRKLERSVELRRVMGLFINGISNEDANNNNSSGPSGPSNLKSSPPVAVAEDLKRFRSSVADTCITARGRASKLDEHLHKLDKYCDGVIKKPQRNELVTNDQNPKIGAQIYRNTPTELINQDRPKNVLLNKRVRTSVAETRAELRSNGLRRQPVAVTMAKDRELIEDNNGEPDILKEKIQRLPAGGEGWDKKMKRKRSVGAVFTRPIDNTNGDPKRNLQNKVVSEPGLQSSDSHPYRLGASNGTSGNIHKLEGTSITSRARMSPRNEPDGPANIIGGPIKERIITKGTNNKLNSRDESYTPCASPLTKGKATRTRASSSPGTPRVSGTSETWDNTNTNTNTNTNAAVTVTVTGGGNKITGPTNRKRAAMPAGSGSSMAQWGSQRPQKMSRTRRANLVSPVSNQEEKQVSSDSCSHSDVSVRLASEGTVTNSGGVVSKQFKVKTEVVVVQSPHRRSESEESVGGESRMKEKVKGNGPNGDSEINASANVNVNVNSVNGNNVSVSNVNEGQNVGVMPLVPVGVKVKSVINEESGEGGVRRQGGRNGRGPLIARANGEKMDIAPPMIKPVQRNRPAAYEKNGSNKGRPLKKLSDRKGFSRLGHLQNNGKEFTVKSDDDREELLAAANHARNASYLACSSPFWKKMESIFAPVSSKDRFYLSMQLKSEQDVPGNFSQFHGLENNIVVNFPNEERNGHVKHQGSESFSGRLDSDKTPKEFIPLFQRVLSALIIEDTIDEYEEEEGQDQDTGIIQPIQEPFCDYEMDDYEPRKRARREFECDTMFGVHGQSPHSVKVSFSISGCSNSFRSPSINDSPCEDVHSEVELLAGISKDIQMDSFNISSFDNKYEQMRVDDKLLLELQSIGLYPELVPNLDDKEDEAIKHEIDQLKIRLRQQNGKKKACLEKVCKGVGGSFVGRDLEQVAIDRLVELAHRKLLQATRGASRAGIPKVPKQVALAFGRRTLARCRKFAKSGISCFNVPTLRDVLFAPQDHELEPTSSSIPVANTTTTTTTTRYIGFQNPHQDSRLSSDEAFAINGPISNRGKKKELLLDDVGGKRCDLRKTKPKPKQKAAGVLPMSGNGFGGNNQFTRTLHPVQPSVNVERRDIRMVSQENKEVMPIHELDSLDELGVGPELGGPQDLSSLLNFDDEELQDQYTAGLDIPMDDLTELNMF